MRLISWYHITMFERMEIYYNENTGKAYRCRVFENAYLGNYLLITDAAKILGGSRQAVQYHIRKGNIQSCMTHDGFIICNKEDVERLAKNA